MQTHQLLNVVTRDLNNPQGVLIRAIEPCEGRNIMEERRQKKGVDITNGPGKLTKTMGITMKDHGTSILKPSFYIDTRQKKFFGR